MTKETGFPPSFAAQLDKRSNNTSKEKVLRLKFPTLSHCIRPEQSTPLTGGLSISHDRTHKGFRATPHFVLPLMAWWLELDPQHLRQRKPEKQQHRQVT